MVTGMFSRTTGKERGIALLMCMLSLLLITAIALGLMFMADTETGINSNYRDEQKAYFAAMGGIQEARVRLMLGSVPTVKPTEMPNSAVATSVYYILNANNTDVVEPWTVGNNFFDTQICHEQFTGLATIASDGAAASPNMPCSTTQGSAGWYTAVQSNADPYHGTAGSLDYKWVRITQKANASAGTPYLVAPGAASGTSNYQVCWDGTNQVLRDAAQTSCEDASTGKNYTTVHRLTSLAVTALGSRRMLQMEVAQNPPIVTKGAVDSQDHVTLNGKLDINGYDFCSCQCTTTGSGNSTVTTCVNRGTKTCDRSKYAIYSANTVDNPVGSENLVAGTTPIVAQNREWKYNLPEMIKTYKPGSVDVRNAPYSYSCTAASGSTNGSCGTKSSEVFGIPPAFPPDPVDRPLPDSTYGACNTSVEPWVGAGCPKQQVTYVPGNLQITAGSVGNGILMVDGDLDIHGGLQFYGLILVRGVVKFTGGGSDRTNIYGAVLAGQESYVDNTLGGSAVINFNACALKQSMAPAPPSTLSFHELTY